MAVGSGKNLPWNEAWKKRTERRKKLRNVRVNGGDSGETKGEGELSAEEHAHTDDSRCMSMGMYSPSLVCSLVVWVSQCAGILSAQCECVYAHASAVSVC